jgi:hypothetical protein
LVGCNLARIINLIFDGLLVKQKIVSNRDFSCVHTWIDEHDNACNWQSPNFDKCVGELKEMILSNASQTESDLLTDYLRVALGHVLLASLSDGFAFDSEYTLMKTAFQLYVDRGFSNCRLNGTIIC